jgi:hypothetical protein
MVINKLIDNKILGNNMFQDNNNINHIIMYKILQIKNMPSNKLNHMHSNKNIKK